MIQKLKDRVYVITENLGSNNSAIVTSRGVVLFDTPHKPTDALAWRTFTDSLGALQYVAVSDHHIDHTLTNAFFGGKLIAHALTREKLAANAPTLPLINDLLQTLDPEGVRLINGDFQYRLPDIAINGDMTLYLGDTVLRLLHRKGHTENSIMCYLPEQKILFAGDNVCENGLPCTDQTCFPEIYETLDFIIDELDVDYIVPGHGEICTKREAVRFRGQIEALVARIQDQIDRGASRREISDTIRYEDRIHVDTPAYRGYPAAHLEGFQRRSMEHIYDVLTGANPS